MMARTVHQQLIRITQKTKFELQTARSRHVARKGLFYRTSQDLHNDLDTFPDCSNVSHLMHQFAEVFRILIENQQISITFSIVETIIKAMHQKLINSHLGWLTINYFKLVPSQVLSIRFGCQVGGCPWAAATGGLQNPHAILFSIRQISKFRFETAEQLEKQGTLR